MLSISGKIKELGYFFKGHRNSASNSIVQNSILFIMGLVVSPKKTLVAISQAISGQASEDQLRKFVDNKRTREKLRSLMDEKARCLFLRALKLHHNYLYPIYLIFDGTYARRYSLTMEDLFFVGKGSKKIGNHIFLFGLLLLHDGTRIPLRPRLQRSRKRAKKSYKTQVKIVTEMVKTVSFVNELIVVADSYFLSKEFTDAIVDMDHHYVIASKSNRVVVEGNSERQLSDYVDEEKILSRLRKITLDGKRSRGRNRCKCYSACKRELQIRNLGDVAVVFTRKYRKRGAELKMFASDLTDASLEELVEHYDIRWEIEVFFRELKSLLGFEACRMKSSTAHENWAILVCLGFMYLQDLSQKHQTTQWERWGLRGQPRTTDYLQLHAYLVQRKNIQHVLRAGSTNHDRRRLTEYFGLSA